MLFLIRAVTGCVCFKITGSRPGSFVNTLVKNGVNIWGISASHGEIRCCVSPRDFHTVAALCRGTSQRVHIMSKRGLPFILHKNKKRKGLLVGLALFAVIFKILSMFVWTVNVCEFDTMSETSAREILRRVGIYEGVYGQFDSLKRMQTTALLEFGTLSWITINADGSRGEVNATEKLIPETNDNAPRNLTARTDGQIIRADAYSGVSAVESGEGAAKGTVLISGVVQSESGSARFVHADGIVIAKTRYEETFVIPKEYKLIRCEDTPKTRYSARLFGLMLPLTAAAADGSELTFTHETQAEYNGERASACLIREDLYGFSVIDVKTDEKTAHEIFMNELLLREIFSYGEKTIVSRDIDTQDQGGTFVFTVDYECEENIAEPSPIRISP